jgi:hypothetical protein
VFRVLIDLRCRELQLSLRTAEPPLLTILIGFSC